MSLCEIREADPGKDFITEDVEYRVTQTVTLFWISRFSDGFKAVCSPWYYLYGLLRETECSNDDGDESSTVGGSSWIYIFWAVWWCGGWNIQDCL